MGEGSGSVYKIKWTGHGETTKGFLRRVSPVETNVVASVNVRNMKVDAIVWKSLLDRSMASLSPTTSSHFWLESTDLCIFLGSQLQKYKMAIRPQKYKIVF